MRDIEKAHLVAYAAHLNDRYERGEIAPSTAQNYLSAVNRVMEIARGDRQVRVDPVSEGTSKALRYRHWRPKCFGSFP